LGEAIPLLFLKMLISIKQQMAIKVEWTIMAKVVRCLKRFIAVGAIADEFFENSPSHCSIVRWSNGCQNASWPLSSEQALEDLLDQVSRFESSK
jgi:hypothetical protein